MAQAHDGVEHKVTQGVVDRNSNRTITDIKNFVL